MNIPDRGLFLASVRLMITKLRNTYLVSRAIISGLLHTRANLGAKGSTAASTASMPGMRRGWYSFER